jgi:hypothetical protein
MPAGFLRVRKGKRGNKVLYTGPSKGQKIVLKTYHDVQDL